MAESFKDIGQELRDEASLRLSSKGEARDLVYTENVTLPAGETPRVPFADGNGITKAIPARCVPGAVHPDCPYLKVIDAVRTGGDDHNDNWQITYQVDVRALGLAFPNCFVNDGVERVNERNGGGGEDSVVTWKFTVHNPDTYSAPSLYTTTHPTYTNAILVSEGIARNGNTAIVTRRYVKLPTSLLLSGDYKNDNVLPPSKFVASITLSTTERIANNPSVDTGNDVVESRVDAIDPFRKKQTTTRGAFASPVPLVGYEVDLETGLIYPVTQELVAAGEQGQGVDASAQFSTVDALNTTWAVKTTRKSTTLQTRSWQDVIIHPWPAVLTDVVLIPITSNGLPNRTIVKPVWLCDAYNGPCRAIITEQWSQQAPSVIVPISLQTTPVVYDGVFFQVSIGACLHPRFEFRETSGTNHPVYDFFIRSEVVDQTFYTRWPTSIVLRNVQPFRGGYMARSTEIFSP